jgi:hypothetical protein
MSIGNHIQLRPVLQALGLTGVLEAPDARLSEARAGTLGHVQFLKVLGEEQLARREAAGVTRA